MGITHFPNGVSSFGLPIVGQPHLWLPQGSSVYHVAPTADGGSTSGTGSYESPTSTIQRAVNFVTAGATTANLQGSMIYVPPGRYNEQVTIADRRGIRLIGAGIGLSHIDLTGVSGLANLQPGSNQTAGPGAVLLASRNCIVTGFTFKVILNTYGLYVGDGGRISSAYNYVAQDNLVYGNLFDGNANAGLYGVLVDGIKNCQFFKNEFYELGSGGILVDSGINAPNTGNQAWFNQFKACRGYGVRILASSITRHWSTGPWNSFEDDNGSTMTNPALYEAVTGPNSYFGNWEACSAEFSGLSTDWHAGNFEGLAGNAMTHVSMA